ncbi:MAG: hypothetical protein ACRCZ3_09950 [Providencia rustigianii]|uniref:hypothetical protein n=1 Tax=Providencia rustigianii TaxID=158850 RepID=UPI003F376D92
MRNQKTPEQWRELIQRRQFFSGSNIDYCKKHHISVKMFYKKRVQFTTNTLNEQTHVTTSVSVPTNSNVPESMPSSPRFIPVLPSTVPDSNSTTANSVQTHFTYNTHTGVLTLPTSIPISDVVLLLQGIAP